LTYQVKKFDLYCSIILLKALAHLLNSTNSPVKPKLRIVLFLTIAFVWSWVSWFIGLHFISSGVNDKTIKPFITFLFIGIYGPMLSAIATTWRFDGLAGVARLLKKLTIWKAPLIIYLVILFLPLIIPAISIGLYRLFYGSVGRFDVHAVALIPIYLWAALRLGPLGEELGWRGFLLPELQRSFSPVKSSLIIGIVWTCWHIPLFFGPIGTAVSGAPVTIVSVLFFYIFVTCLACIYTWLVNRSHGSVLTALLIHLFINAGLVMLFFPDLAAHSKQLYYFSAPVFIAFTLYLGLKTRFK